LQIILPVVLAGLLLIGVVILISWATFRASGDVGRWAAISTMWLTIPVMIGGVVILVVLIAVAYGLRRLAGFIPPYTYQAQQFASKVQAGARHAGELAHRPIQILPEVGRLIRKVFQLIRKVRATPLGKVQQ
jgi:hypothetical protein